MTRRTAVLLVVLALTPSARADKVVLVAGGGDGPDGSKATEAKVIQPFAVDFAADGSLLFVEMAGGERLRRIGPDGRVTTLAGSGQKGFAGDGGPALKAEFNGMHNLLVGPDGSVYLADAFNNRVRRYDPKAGSVTAFAGTGANGFAGDGGTARTAEINQTI